MNVTLLIPDPSNRRVAHGLPEDLSHPVVANFNKLDKLDPESFLLWMQILRRVPGCVLWLLDPDAVESEVRFMHACVNVCLLREGI